MLVRLQGRRKSLAGTVSLFLSHDRIVNDNDNDNDNNRDVD